MFGFDFGVPRDARQNMYTIANVDERVRVVVTCGKDADEFLTNYVCKGRVTGLLAGGKNQRSLYFFVRE